MEEKNKIRIVYTTLFILAAVITGYFQYAYEKSNASWCGVNIYFWALILCPIIAVTLTVINHLIVAQFGGEFSFDYEQFTPGPFLYAFMMAGCLLSIYLGISFTEPHRGRSSDRAEIQQSDRNTFVQLYEIFYDDSGTVSSSSDSDSDSDGDSAIAKLITVVIVIIILSILLLSAKIQHFWVIGSITILLMMLPFLLRVWKSEKDTTPWKRFKRGRGLT